MNASRFVSLFAILLGLAVGCTTRGHSMDVPDTGNGTGTDTGPLPPHDAAFVFPDAPGSCANGSCYTLYAHSDHYLYTIDLAAHMLHEVGHFNAPHVGGSEDVITDLAVAPDDTIYAVSHTALYTVSPMNGQVTMLATLASCGTETVALSFDHDGHLFAGDYAGAFCEIDVTTTPPSVSRSMMLSGNYALAGDLVAVADGTMFGTVVTIGDSTTDPNSTVNMNLLARIDTATGTVTIVGNTGAPKLFGTAYQMGQVFGFTHDGTGRVFTIDHTSGVGTLFGTFNDPTTGRPISFAGAGVNANVPIAPM